MENTQVNVNQPNKPKGSSTEDTAQTQPQGETPSGTKVTLETSDPKISNSSEADNNNSSTTTELKEKQITVDKEQTEKKDVEKDTQLREDTETKSLESAKVGSNDADSGETEIIAKNEVQKIYERQISNQLTKQVSTTIIAISLTIALSATLVLTLGLSTPLLFLIAGSPLVFGGFLLYYFKNNYSLEDYNRAAEATTKLINSLTENDDERKEIFRNSLDSERFIEITKKLAKDMARFVNKSATTYQQDAIAFETKRIIHHVFNTYLGAAKNKDAMDNPATLKGKLNHIKNMFSTDEQIRNFLNPFLPTNTLELLENKGKLFEGIRAGVDLLNITEDNKIKLNEPQK